MIDWHHPRIYERLRCFGLTLFTLGVASPRRDCGHHRSNAPGHTAQNRPRNRRDEERASLERKLRHIDLINALAIVPAALGAMTLFPHLSDLGMFVDLTDSGAREPQ